MLWLLASTLCFAALLVGVWWEWRLALGKVDWLHAKVVEQAARIEVLRTERDELVRGRSDYQQRADMEMQERIEGALEMHDALKGRAGLVSHAEPCSAWPDLSSLMLPGPTLADVRAVSPRRFGRSVAALFDWTGFGWESRKTLLTTIANIWSESELLAIPGVGPQTVAQIRRLLDEAGLLAGTKWGCDAEKGAE